MLTSNISVQFCEGIHIISTQELQERQVKRSRQTRGLRSDPDFREEMETEKIPPKKKHGLIGVVHQTQD